MTFFPFGGGCPALPLNLTEAAHLVMVVGLEVSTNAIVDTSSKGAAA
jgi:hypothetical protein